MRRRGLVVIVPMLGLLALLPGAVAGCETKACERRVAEREAAETRAARKACRSRACKRRTCRSAACRARVQAKRMARISAADQAWLRRVRYCESGSHGLYRANTGNGFYGAYQFTLSSWGAVGGVGMPHLASPAEQDMRALRLRALQGVGAWPNCG